MYVYHKCDFDEEGDFNMMSGQEIDKSGEIKLLIAWCVFEIFKHIVTVCCKAKFSGFQNLVPRVSFTGRCLLKFLLPNVSNNVNSFPM